MAGRKRGQAKAQTAVAVAKPLTASEQSLVDRHAARIVERGARRPPRFTNSENPGNRTTVTAMPDFQNSKLFWAQLGEATGTAHEAAQTARLIELTLLECATNKDPASSLTATVADMLEIAPRDGLEGMLAAQMVGVHATAMKFLKEAKNNEGRSIEMGTYYMNHATRLSRLFCLQMETLQRYRGKAPSEQRVVVEHVTVHEGGQAIVGNVNAPPKNSDTGGGGGDESSLP